MCARALSRIGPPRDWLGGKKRKSSEKKTSEDLFDREAAAFAVSSGPKGKSARNHVIHTRGSAVHSTQLTRYKLTTVGCVGGRAKEVTHEL